MSEAVALSPRQRFGLRLGLAHELGFAVAMTLAAASVLLGGELPLFAWLVVAAPWISFALAARGRTAPALSATLVGLAGVGLAVVTLLRGGVESSVLAGAELLLALLTARLLVRETANHDLQAIALSLFLVLTASALNVSLSYIVVFVPYAVAVVWALTTRQLLAVATRDADVAIGGGLAPASRAERKRERERARRRSDVVTPFFFAGTAAVALAVLASAVVVFAAFPRVGLGEIGAFLLKETKLPRSVGLRGDPRLVGSTAAVARVRGVSRDAFDAGLYLRGVVYDVVTLEGFSQSPGLDDARRRGPVIQLAAAPRDGRYEIALMPLVGDTLLTLGGVVAARAISGGRSNPNLAMGVAGKTPLDELKAYAALTSPMRYEIAGGIATPGFVPGPAGARARKPKPLGDDERARYLALPAGVDAVLAGVAAEALAALPGATGEGAGPRAEAAALRALLLERFVYSQTPPRTAASPLRTFLVDDRQGHCEYFASGFALLLRSRGIPARVVGGFQGGAWDDDVIVFQERHAHAWVEWWDDEAGWIVDDATPLASAAREDLTGFASLLERARRLWDDRVLDYSMQDQADALTKARRAVRRLDAPGAALLAGALVPVAIAVLLVARRRLRRRRSARVDPLAEALLAAVARVTRAPIAASTTVREAVDGAAPLVSPGDLEVLRAGLHLYERRRFGHDDADAPADPRAGRAAVARARRALRAIRARLR